MENQHVGYVPTELSEDGVYKKLSLKELLFIYRAIE
jgi:hypothetical protein